MQILRKISRYVRRPPKKLERLPSLSIEQRTPTFTAGMGRSGTHFWAYVMAANPNVIARHQSEWSSEVADSFTRFCRWYDLPVDYGSFLQSRRIVVQEAGDIGRQYFESNSYLALHLDLLAAELNAQFIHVIRKPEDVVNSHYVKGWYSTSMLVDDASLVPGYQYDLSIGGHYFGRFAPRGKDEFERWQRLTRIGKIAWFWNTLNKRVVEQLSALPKDRYLTARTEEVDYQRYCELHAFVTSLDPLSRTDFDKLRNNRPGKGKKHRTTDSWSTREREEFLNETHEMRAYLGYA